MNLSLGQHHHQKRHHLEQRRRCTAAAAPRMLRVLRGGRREQHRARKLLTPCAAPPGSSSSSSSSGSEGLHPAAVSTATAAGPAAAGGAPLPWHHVDEPLLWRGAPDTVLAPGSPLAQESPAWRMMLLSDGSVTRHLELLTGRETTVDCLQMATLSGAEAAAAPAAAARIAGPLLQRQSLLRAGADAGARPLVYAASWWCAASVTDYLADARAPIWRSLAAGRVEVYREVLEVYRGRSAPLERLLGCRGPFWGRSYYFVRGGQPLTLIHEVFSAELERLLAGGGGGGGGGTGVGGGAV